MENELLALACGPLELKLAPATGGAIARFDYVENGQRVPVLRPGPSPLGSVLEAASFPLVPFVNRIRDGQFDFRGRRVNLAPNMPGDPSPLHGQSWLGQWTIDRSSAQAADLVFEHEAGEWPWAYRSVQHFALDERGLAMSIDCRNLSDEPMPCGLGMHPYFNCTPQTRIDTRVEHVWTIDDLVLPVDKLPADGRYSLANEPVCGRNLDNGYGGWDGSARLTDPAWPFDILLASAGTRFFQLYSPAQGGIFVAEPVTHANDALSAPEADWEALGLRILDPGEAMRLDARIDVTPK